MYIYIYIYILQYTPKSESTKIFEYIQRFSIISISGTSTGSTGSGDQSVPRSDGNPMPFDTPESLQSPKKLENLPSPLLKKTLFKKGNEDGRDK